ncbi:anaerobic glycerol-3-phosphate dehydrogenase subunit B [Candidatus Thorarchaeota archaeon]|nr:MAG: anaerobic glycerol-3-phosphate dehydrogenase subunit B [Candidatus Thorarchaeota archaeon]
MDIQSDLVVIGGGLSGLVAGTVAAQAGLETLLLRKGQSATAYSSGAIDVIGYLPEAVEPFSSPPEGLAAIAGLYPLHPYSIVGYDESVTSENVTDTILEKTRLAIDWLKTHLEPSISPLVGDFNVNTYPITVFGTKKPTCLIQKTMDHQDLELRDDSVLLFVGFSGYPDFNPAAAAKTYLEDRLALEGPPRKVGHCFINIAPFGKSYNLSSIEIAKHLDHEGSIDRLAALLKEQVDQVGATHVAFPPILGIRKAVQNIARLQEYTGATIFELLGIPPSIPGQRLQRSMEETFTTAGGKLLIGFEATSCIKKENQIQVIVAKTQRRQVKIEAKAFILSTGKFIGGGITGDETGFRENIFNLMTVTRDYHTARDLIPSRFTNRLAISPSGQPVQYCGLSVDPRFRPINEDGIEWAENLFAAGAILAGYNYSVEKSGLGVAITTGYYAAQNAIALVKEAV